MKMLVIGIDGGDKRIIDGMVMPNLQAILSEGTCLDIEEDLWSRGWAEILSGTHGIETGAFYSKPKLDGSHAFTQSFDTNSYKNNGSVVPLWTRLLELGSTVGFMNVPTTMPAPKVNGFFVSGAGGGYSPAAGIPSVACFPDEVWDELRRMAYIWETRFMASGIKEKDVFMSRAIETLKRRSTSFVYLCRKYRPRFGFLMHKEPTVIQNLAMSEIEALIKNRGSSSNDMQEMIVEFYQCLDEALAKVLEELQPRHVIVLSDHGQVPYLTSMNMDVFLRELGMQKQISAAVRTPRSLLKQLKRFVPRGIKRGIKSAVPQMVASVQKSDVDWSKTLAFGARYISGVYINDRRRFGGPIEGEAAIDELAHQIVAEFNKTEEATKHCLNARIYRNVYKDAMCSELLPDVWIDHPDTVFFEGHGQFVSENKDYGPIKTLRNIKRDMYTGIKGRKPMLCINKGICEYLEDHDPSDLTLAYRIIERVMLS